MTEEMRRMTDWLFNLTKFGEKNGLENIRELLRRLGDPQNSFRSVHVAGSDGKGSTCAFISSVLRHAGYRTGLYTSPHIIRVNERVSVDGREITDEQFLRLAHKVEHVIGEMREEGFACTFFEAMTAIGFLHFRDEGVEYAVVEVGMGGRFDATNVVIPEVSVICSISLEHTKFLGDTIEKIAFEKAGIIKPGVPVVTCNSGAALDVIREVADSRGSVLCRTEAAVISGQSMSYRGMTYTPGIPGSFQASNSVMAVEAVRRTSAHVPDDVIAAGLAGSRWPGRMQKVDGLPLIVDVTHTAAGMLALARDIVARYGRVVTVFGVLDDKDVGRMSESVAEMSDHVVVTRPRSDRALPAEAVMEAVSRHTSDAEAVSDVSAAIEKALGISRGRMVVVTGSFAMAEAAFVWLGRTLP